VQGFNNAGIFLGYDSNEPKVSLIGASGSLIWNGQDLTIQGSINSNDGNIGGWTIGEGSIISSNQNIQLYSDPSESIAVFDDSGSLRFFANTQLTLPSPTGVVYSPAILPTVSTSSFQQNGVPNDGTYSSYYGGTIAYDWYVIPSSGGSFTAGASGQHVITYTMPLNYASYASAIGDADCTLNVNLQLTRTGHAPQLYTEFVGQSNYAIAYAQGSIQTFQTWNGFGWDTTYYPSGQTVTLPATKFSLIADLQQGVTYYLTLRGYSYLHSMDTSLPLYPPFGIDSQAETSFVLSSAGSISIKTVSAGTVVNGGGFQAVLADDKYLRVTDGLSGSYNFSTEITGSLMVDRAISSFSNGYGYPPAVKAFGTVRYDGTNSAVAGNYTILNRYNISSTLSLDTFNRYVITFANPLDSTDYIVLFTVSNITYSSQEIGNIAVITGKSTTGFTFRIERPSHTSPGIVTTWIGGNLSLTQATEFVDFVILSR
jgi:hypothetical protein